MIKNHKKKYLISVWDKKDGTCLKECSDYYWHLPRALDGEEIVGEANLVGLSEFLCRPDEFTVEISDNPDFLR